MTALAAFAIYLAIPAAGFSTTESSVVAMGAGGTAAARADDAAAGGYNPAAVAGAPGFRAAAGVVLAAPRIEARAPLWASETTASLSVPPHVHLAWSGERFLAGASLTVPFGSRVSWPEDWQKRFDLQNASLTVLRLSGFAGVRFGPVALAAGPFVDFGSLDIARAIDFIEVEGKTKLETRATGFGALAGIYVDSGETFDFGLAYRSRSRLKLTGYADFDVPDEFQGNAPDQAVSTELTMPDRVTLGVLWHVTPAVDVYLDVEANLWNTIEALELDFADEATRDVRQPRDWRWTIVPRIGASWVALDWLTVRGGVFYDTSPAPPQTVGPSTPDSNRVGLTLGASVALPAGFEVSLAYAHLELLGAKNPEEVRFAGRADLAGASIGFRL